MKKIIKKLFGSDQDEIDSSNYFLGQEIHGNPAFIIDMQMYDEDFKYWDRIAAYNSWQAACLAYELQPGYPPFRYPRRVHELKETLIDAVFNGEFDISIETSLENRKNKNSRFFVETHHDFKRSDLIEFFKRMDWQPAFLHKEKRKKESDSEEFRELIKEKYGVQYNVEPEEKVSSNLESQQEFFSTELDAALSAWKELFGESSDYAINNPAINTKNAIKPKDLIYDWLKENRPELSEVTSTADRITTICNPDVCKTGKGLMRKHK